MGFAKRSTLTGAALVVDAAISESQAKSLR